MNILMNMLSAVVAGLATTQSAMIAWPDGLRLRFPAPHHQAPMKAPESAPLPAKDGKPITLISANPASFSEAEMAACAAHDATWWQSLDTARRLFRAHYLTHARAVLEAYRFDNPDDSPTADLYADICFRQGDPQSALTCLAPLATRLADPELLLRASLAAARRGIVVAGQREFCVRYILRRNHDVTDAANWLLQGNSPRAVEAISCLALGHDPTWNEDIRVYYLQECVRLDPGNPIACEMLGSIEGGKPNCHYAFAAQIYSQGIPRASGTILDMLKSKRDAVQYLHGLVGG